MVASGCEVPEYILKLKKASQNVKKRLKVKPVIRPAVIEESKYDQKKRKRKEEMIKGTKGRKVQV